VILEFLAAAILIELTPGPNMTWLAVLGAAQGRTRALAAVAGISLGLSVAALVAGAGLTAVLYQMPALFTALRWAGTVYLLYLAWEAWSNAEDKNEAGSTTSQQAFRHGLISNTLNPKAYLFYAAVLPHFVDTKSDAVPQIALLSVTYVTVATLIHAAIATASGGLSNWLQRSPRAVQLRKGMAMLIAATALWFFISTGQEL
jgi:threonine/homoserine/homoserine lactone efflux protein